MIVSPLSRLRERGQFNVSPLSLWERGRYNVSPLPLGEGPIQCLPSPIGRGAEGEGLAD
jgi:hypothetical protein